ncbi:MAG: EAL domain-containing protein [Steroidobacteraceae bacterium]
MLNQKLAWNSLRGFAMTLALCAAAGAALYLYYATQGTSAAASVARQRIFLDAIAVSAAQRGSAKGGFERALEGQAASAAELRMLFLQERPTRIGLWRWSGSEPQLVAIDSAWSNLLVAQEREATTASVATMYRLLPQGPYIASQPVTMGQGTRVIALLPIGTLPVAATWPLLAWWLLAAALAAIAALGLARPSPPAALLRAALESPATAVLQQMIDGVLLVDPATLRIVDCNPAACTQLGRKASELRGADLGHLVSDESIPSLWDAIVAARADTTHVHEVDLFRSDRSPYHTEAAVSSVNGPSGTLACLLLRDVSGRKHAEKQILERQRKLEHLANHDPLTHLPNRLFLNSRLPELLEEATQAGRELAVCYIDIDNFKNINDSCGHETGDAFLRRVAERLKGAVRDSDLVARISGDEFVVVKFCRDHATVERFAARLVAVLRDSLNVEGRVFETSASIGISVSPQDGQDMGELMRRADIALYQAKEGGKNSYRFFAPEMSARVSERMALEAALREALSQGAISAHFQPIVDLRNERVVALEALARWRHPKIGQVPPTQFIRVAEDAGLIIELGDAIIESVATQLAVWNGMDLPRVQVAINVSAQQLTGRDFRERVCRIIDRHGIAPRQLQLEITESVVMRDIERQVDILQGLREAGFEISIDDFGTGYSSLSYLKHLPIDHLKIDRSFVRDMAVDANDAAIVSAIVSMARNLKLETIAEGVETAQHAMRLAALGCDFAQGYYYSGAVSADDCTSMLTAVAERDRLTDTVRMRALQVAGYS